MVKIANHRHPATMKHAAFLGGKGRGGNDDAVEGQQR